MADRDDDLISDVEKWRLTEPLPQQVSEVIDGELEVIRQLLIDVVRRTRRTPINAAAAVYALADVAAYVLAQAEDLQNLLGGRPRDRLQLETGFNDRFRSRLVQQRGYRLRR